MFPVQLLFIVQRSVAEGTVDFESIERHIARLPAALSPEPRYGLFLFGAEGRTRVWFLLDRSNAAEPAYDVLYIDLDADGDLSEPGERFLGEVPEAAPDQRVFRIGDFRPPGTQDVHGEFTIKWWPEGIRYRMHWRGEDFTQGPFGRTAYGTLAASIAAAPVFVPGDDLPLRFATWGARPLLRGESTDFRVLVGNQGSGAGTFSAMDITYLDDTALLFATLVYRDTAGREREYVTELRGRC